MNDKVDDLGRRVAALERFSHEPYDFTWLVELARKHDRDLVALQAAVSAHCHGRRRRRKMPAMATDKPFLGAELDACLTRLESLTQRITQNPELLSDPAWLDEIKQLRAEVDRLKRLKKAN